MKAVFAPMSSGKISTRLQRALVIPVLLLLTAVESRAYSILLEGQNKGDTNNWFAGNLQGWQELDYVPCRVHWSSAQGNSNFVRIDFPRAKSGIPGFQDLFSFSNSANVVFSALPTLSAPPSSSTWSYSFTVNILNNQAAYVYFTARMS